MTRATALLAPEVDRDALDTAAEALAWQLLNIYARTEERPRQLFFGLPDGDGIAVLVEDHRIGTSYLVVEGHAPELALDLAARHLRELTRDEVLAELSEHRARTIAWLGIARPAVLTPAIDELLDEALQDEDANVRRAASFAAEALGR